MTEFVSPHGSAGYTLLPLKPAEIAEARRLCDDCVGKNLYGDEEIARAISAPDHFFFLLKDAGGEAVGYLYWYLTAPEAVAADVKLDIGQIRSVLPTSCSRVGKLQAVGLRADHRGRGLAAQMIRFALRRMAECGVHTVFIVCWKPGGIVPLGKALAECRFRELAQSRLVWFDKVGLVCPYCGGRCRCDAEVYYKTLGEDT